MRALKLALRWRGGSETDPLAQRATKSKNRDGQRNQGGDSRRNALQAAQGLVAHAEDVGSPRGRRQRNGNSARNQNWSSVPESPQKISKNECHRTTAVTAPKLL